MSGEEEIKAVEDMNQLEIPGLRKRDRTEDSPGKVVL